MGGLSSDGKKSQISLQTSTIPTWRFAMSALYNEIQRLIANLSAEEQTKLLQSLIARTFQEADRDSTSIPNPADAWNAFVRAGEAVAASDRPDLPTLTKTVHDTRRRNLYSVDTRV